MYDLFADPMLFHSINNTPLLLLISANLCHFLYYFQTKSLEDALKSTIECLEMKKYCKSWKLNSKMFLMEERKKMLIFH